MLLVDVYDGDTLYLTKQSIKNVSMFTGIKSDKLNDMLRQGYGHCDYFIVPHKADASHFIDVTYKKRGTHKTTV